MRLEKYDELDSLIRGILFVESHYPRECYYWADPTDDDKCRKVTYDFSRPYPFIVSNRSCIFNYLVAQYFQFDATSSLSLLLSFKMLY